MTVAAATGLVAGSAFTSYTTVYADEGYNKRHDYDERAYDDRRPYRQDDNHNSYRQDDRRSYRQDDHNADDDDSFDYRERENEPRHQQPRKSSSDHHSYRTRISSPQHSLVANEEELLPGLLYVALAGLSGSLVARQRNILVRMFSPVAFATAAGAIFLPDTTHSVIDSIGGSMATHRQQDLHPHQHHAHARGHLSDQDRRAMTAGDTSELTSKAREAWRTAESHAQDVAEPIRESGRQMAHQAEQGWDRGERAVQDTMDDMHEKAPRTLKRHRTSKPSSSSSYWFHVKGDEMEDEVDELGDRVQGTARDMNRRWRKTSDEAEDKFYEMEGRAKDAAREAKYQWNKHSSEVEDTAREVAGKAKEATREAKHWWDKHEPEAEQKAKELEIKAKETAKEVKHWWNKTAPEVEEKAKELGSKAKEATKEAKHWWDKHAPEAEEKLYELKDKSIDASKQANEKLHELVDKSKEVSKQTGEKLSEMKDKSVEVKAWIEDKAHDAEKIAEDVAHKAVDAAKKTKGWVDETSEAVEKKLEASAHEADEWWKTQAAVTEQREKEIMEKERKNAESAWYHLPRSERAAVTAEREHGHDDRLRNREPSFSSSGMSYVSSDSYMDGILDNRDLDHPTMDESGAARMGKTRFPDRRSHLDGSIYRDDYFDPLHPREPEYWSNGEEMSSASVRDASYYNYPGSFTGSSLGRTSWWSRRIHDNTTREHENNMLKLKDKAESLVWETKQEAERAALDFATKLSEEQARLEKMATEARARAEAAALHAKAHSEALIRERQAAVERAAKEMEAQYAEERAAAEKAAKEAKEKAQAWELEQRRRAELMAKDVQDRVLREKIAAEATAAQLKARADAWARDQKEKAEMAAKEIHERVLHETAAAEKGAQEAKAALEAKVKEEKIKMERAARDLEEKVRHEKLKEEQEKESLRARAETMAMERKLKGEKTARELEEIAKEAKAKLEANLLSKKRATENAQVEARESKSRTEALLAESKRSAERSAKESADNVTQEAPKATTSRWSWPWSRSTSGAEVSTERTSPSTSSKRTQERYDSSGQLLEHIAEDVKQTKGDIQGGLGHLKDSVLNATTHKSTSTKPATSTAELGRNVEAAAIKAERDVKVRAAIDGKNMNDTAKKAYDNVIDAATTGSDQRSVSHAIAHGHVHGSSKDQESHTLANHIRDDLRHTKDDIQHGVEHLKEVVLGAEKAVEKAVIGAEHNVEEVAEKAAEKTAAEGISWWSYRNKSNKNAERKASELDGEKIREAGREAAESDADFWFRTEQQRRQNLQQERRESGRAIKHSEMSGNKAKRPFVVKDSDDDSDADYKSKSEDESSSQKAENKEENPESSSESSPKKPKVIKMTSAKKNKDGDTYFEIGPKKRLTVRSWRDTTLIDIREYYQDKDGEQKPGKKGISLNKDQFQYILNHASEISDAISTAKS
ncbi:Transcriptional coactivator [Haplosporangium sp. Z 767]|nr:Transcriptional coactivator [Haplosporangium sp. Z 767]KAF9195562.1 Transcriptional coactivator [Haplosporangium sp. Z 11]